MLKHITTLLSKFIPTKITYAHDTTIIESIAEHFAIPIEKVLDFLNTGLSIVHAPNDLSGINKAETALTVIVSQMLETERIDKVIIELANSILSTWFGELAARKKHYNDKVEMEKHFVFAFYVHAFRSKPQVLPFYNIFCLKFNIIIEKILAEPIEENTKRAYIRSCRYFFVYMPDDIKFRDNFNEPLLDNDINIYIDKAIEMYRKKCGDAAETPQNASVEHKRRLRVLLIDKTQIRPHPHTSGEGTLYTFDDGSQGATCEMGDIIPEYLADDVDDLSEKINRDFFFDDRYDQNEMAIPHPPSLRGRLFDTLHLRSHSFFFDSNRLNLYHMSLLIIIVERSWGAAPKQEKLIMIFVLFLFYMGLSPELAMLMKIHTGTVDAIKLAKDCILIMKTSTSYYLVKESPIEKPAPPVAGCRNSTAVVKVPLPPYLEKYVDQIWESQREPGYFFSLKKPFNKTAFNLDAVRKFLHKVKIQFQLAITPKEISSSFFSFFSKRYGLDEVIAAYVSGVNYRIFGSRLNYIYVNASRLECAYLAVAKTVEDRIRRNIAQLNITYDIAADNSLMLMEQHKETAKEFIPPSCQLSGTDTNDCGYGSAIVPETETLKAYIDSVKTTLEKFGWTNIIMRHNVFICQLYMCAQFNFALRPRNNPPFGFNHFARNLFETINDKLSRVYYEERLLPVSPILKDMVDNFRTGFPRVIRYIGGKINPSVLQISAEKIFFFLGEDGTPQPFLLKTFEKVLSDAYIPYSFDRKSIRHYVRTYFYEHNSCHDLADAWLGHHHVAKEPLGISSALVYRDLIVHGLKQIDNLLTEIGFSPVSYLP